MPDPAPANTLETDINADWLVIGGGFAGLAAAQRLTDNRPEDKTVLLEAIRIGDNSAGCSSGFMIDQPHDISADSYTSDIESDKQQMLMSRTAVMFAKDAAEKYDFSQETFDPRGKIYSSAPRKGITTTSTMPNTSANWESRTSFKPGRFASDYRHRLLQFRHLYPGRRHDPAGPLCTQFCPRPTPERRGRHL